MLESAGQAGEKDRTKERKQKLENHRKEITKRKLQNAKKSHLESLVKLRP